MAKAAKKAAKVPATGAAKTSAKIGAPGAARRFTKSVGRGVARESTPPAKRSPSTGPPSRGSASPRTAIPKDIRAYNAAQSSGDQRICDMLAATIARHLPAKADGAVECKIWHRHPVWFLDGNPIVGYHKLKSGGGCIRLLFWSGRSFEEPGLAAEAGFQTAGARYTSADQISARDLKRWLEKSIAIQWDYKNIVKRKGRLERLM